MTPKLNNFQKCACTAFMLLGFAGCSPKLSVQVIKVPETRVESTVNTTTSGTIEAEQQAILAFNTVGRVSRIQGQVGAHVKKNDILAELENRDLKSIYDQAFSDFDRSQKLFAEGLISKSAVDEARKGFEIGKAAFEKSLIRAPFDGLISEINLQIGELSAASSSMTAAGVKAPIRLLDLKPRLIKGEIDEIDISKVKISMPARVKILAVGKDIFQAHVSQVVPFVGSTREQDRTSQIELRFGETPDQLIPVGASADIEIIVEVKDNVLAVPTRALGGSPQNRSVFVVENNRLSKRSIKTGIGNYIAIEVVSGLNKGDHVALRGDSFELKEGMKIESEIIPWP